MKNKKGFTLIELLAVIVILGLLMAIAIPGISKYITQSRKKTLTTTVVNYVNSLMAEVNNMEYEFEDSGKVYAIPIECIPLEKGGKNPFGEWHQANDKYWAYVLVQYDEDKFSHKYGFTFKDSSGYGIYPTSEEKFNSKGEQIKVKLTLEKPESGKITNIADVDKWDGFEVNANTDLIVLEAESEGKKGDGIKTCTLYNKGNNYDEVEAAKKEKQKDYVLMKASYDEPEAFWVYKKQIKTITFEKSINIPSTVEDKYKWDVSATKKGKVMAYFVPNETDSTYFDLYIQGDGELYANPDSSYLFAEFYYLDSINNIELLDTSNVTNMEGMFEYTGYKSNVFTLDLGDNFDTSKVTNMAYMFSGTGYSSKKFKLDLGDKFNTSKVTNMTYMFWSTGFTNSDFTLDLGDNFDTSKVTDMNSMFMQVGYANKTFKLDLGDKFDTSNVTDMGRMFFSYCKDCTKFELNLGDKFDTSNVTNMSEMFLQVGFNSESITLDLGDKFNTSKVTNMSKMFSHLGRNSSSISIDVSGFDVGQVSDMSSMFNNAGYYATSFSIGDISKWNTSNVINMSSMFFQAGLNADYYLNLSEWDVGKVTKYGSFKKNVEDKIDDPWS